VVVVIVVAYTPGEYNSRHIEAVYTRAVRIAVIALPSPFGPIHAAVDERSVVALELMTTTEAFRASAGRRTGGDILELAEASQTQRRLLERVEREIAEYLDGWRHAFDLPVDLGRASGWDRKVLDGVRRVPWGSVTSYGRLARSIGARGAARAVGGAVGRNPIGLLVPCHRVIAGDGSLGGYGGAWTGTEEESLALKRALLRHEGVELPAHAFFE
jgi:methylated-DNA-[protein]-cysteine S-methyltransferase